MGAVWNGVGAMCSVERCVDVWSCVERCGTEREVLRERSPRSVERCESAADVWRCVVCLSERFLAIGVIELRKRVNA